MLWLRGENDEEPPTLWSSTEDDLTEISNSIASFSNDLILGSVSDAHCENHPTFEADCESCNLIKIYVEKFQYHRHKFSCHKKKKIVTIKADEGFGRLDGKTKGDALTFPSCRFNFPRNPMDKSEFIYGFPENTDVEVLKKAKQDYQKIRKYLQRLTHSEDYFKTETWNQFVNWSFFEFLYEVGMFEKDDSQDDPEAQQKARDRYLTALRCVLSTKHFL